MCSLLGNRALGVAAVCHQATYIYPPLSMLLAEEGLAREMFGLAAELPIEAWAPFFIVSHGLAALFIWNASSRMGAIATLSTALGYLSLSFYSSGAPLGALAEAWSISPHMLQNFALAVMLTMDAFSKRTRRSG